MNILLKKCLVRATLLIAYTALGGVLFWQLEGKDVSNSEESENLLDSLRSDIRAKGANWTAAQFRDFTQKAHQALELKSKRNWDFTNGCYFVLIALTTIGYGDLVPETGIGRMLCILYSVIGLPLTMIFLKSLGEAITIGIKKFLNLCEKRILRKRLTCRMQVKIMIVTMICIWNTMCLCSVITMYTDGYSFLDSFYAWFITFSTIGFGDFVPLAEMETRLLAKGMDNAALVTIRTLSVVPAIFGICMVAAFLSAVLDLMTHIKFSQIFESAPHVTVSDTVDAVSTTALAMVTHTAHFKRMATRRRSSV